MTITAYVRTASLTSSLTQRIFPSVSATCSRCGHCVESSGTGPRSVKRCLTRLWKECPKKEENFYVEYRRPVIGPRALTPEVYKRVFTITPGRV